MAPHDLIRYEIYFLHLLGMKHIDTQTWGPLQYKHTLPDTFRSNMIWRLLHLLDCVYLY